jgi:hypothetical protein
MDEIYTKEEIFDLVLNKSNDIYQKDLLIDMYKKYDDIKWIFYTENIQYFIPPSYILTKFFVSNKGDMIVITIIRFQHEKISIIPRRNNYDNIELNNFDKDLYNRHMKLITKMSIMNLLDERINTKYENMEMSKHDTYKKQV